MTPISKIRATIIRPDMVNILNLNSSIKLKTFQYQLNLRRKLTKLKIISLKMLMIKEYFHKLETPQLKEIMINRVTMTGIRNKKVGYYYLRLIINLL